MMWSTRICTLVRMDSSLVPVVDMLCGDLGRLSIMIVL
jgi:hypothetical protein